MPIDCGGMGSSLDEGYMTSVDLWAEKIERWEKINRVVCKPKEKDNE